MTGGARWMPHRAAPAAAQENGGAGRRWQARHNPHRVATRFRHHADCGQPGDGAHSPDKGTHGVPSLSAGGDPVYGGRPRIPGASAELIGGPARVFPGRRCMPGRSSWCTRHRVSRCSLPAPCPTICGTCWPCWNGRTRWRAMASSYIRPDWPGPGHCPGPQHPAPGRPQRRAT